MRGKELVPLGARYYLRARQREWQNARRLRRGLRRLRKDPRGGPDVWNDLVDGWDNKRWSAWPEYLDVVAAEALAHRGPVLECGSGLSTLVLAAVAERTASEVWTLENDAMCLQRVRSHLERFALTPNVVHAPLRDYGDFEWYEVDKIPLPDFSLVVCDGPPKRTHGGRFGLVPVMRDRLVRGCVILLDDAARADEREILQRWAADLPLRYEVRGETKPYAYVELL